ncbi:heterokaryon incompatibility protein Het-C-domain-containing protein [Mycena crocata]|nr:heterokaryon incompatibility protein Het-C-domain-containing protein [Mycena crocata]
MPSNITLLFLLVLFFVHMSLRERCVHVRRGQQTSANRPIQAVDIATLEKVPIQTEHIDNPKGCGDSEDPRKYHPKLRRPVEPIELDVDHRTGMKNNIANDSGHWATSKALVKQTPERCTSPKTFPHTRTSASLHRLLRRALWNGSVEGREEEARVHSVVQQWLA